MEGGMHLLMSIQAGVGHIYGDIGLRDMLVHSKVYAAGTVDHMFKGKDYDRMMRALKLLDQALTDRLLYNFSQWCVNNNKVLPAMLTDLLNKVTQRFAKPDICQTKFDLTDYIDPLEQFTSLMDEFKTTGCEQSATFRFWCDFLDHVMTPLKTFIGGSKTVSWEIHTSSKA